ncbi:MAG: F0F1 ATP synthase subunit epsilon [Candidatus Omnitrophota bacterium]
MAESMHLEVITSADLSIRGNIKQLVVPTFKGETGILPDHRLYITLLDTGEIRYTDTLNKDHYLFIRDGFLEVGRENMITLISDSIETAETLLAEKETIEKEWVELNNKIKEFQILKEDMTEKDILAMPSKLAQTLNRIRELEIKKKIIQKVDKK